MSYITNSGARTWHRMSKNMKFIGLHYWEDLFKTLKKIFFPKDKVGVLESKVEGAFRATEMSYLGT